MPEERFLGIGKNLSSSLVMLPKLVRLRASYNLLCLSCKQGKFRNFKFNLKVDCALFNY